MRKRVPLAVTAAVVAAVAAGGQPLLGASGIGCAAAIQPRAGALRPYDLFGRNLVFGRLADAHGRVNAQIPGWGGDNGIFADNEFQVPLDARTANGYVLTARTTGASPASLRLARMRLTRNGSLPHDESVMWVLDGTAATDEMVAFADGRPLASTMLCSRGVRVAPTAAVEGAAASDIVPPVIGAAARVGDVGLATMTIAAKDRGGDADGHPSPASGLAAIYYVVAGTSTRGFYRGALTVRAGARVDVYAFDRAGNVGHRRVVPRVLARP